MHKVTSLGLVALRRGLSGVGAAAFFVAGGAVAEPMFASSAAPLANAPANDAPVLAQIAVSATVNRLETREGFHRVELEGWARDGAERVLFALPGKRILAATVPKANLDALTLMGHMRDSDTGITWKRMRVEGWVAQSTLQAEIDPIWRAAWALFAERCTACHQRRVPEHYTANQWRSLIKVMGPRTGLAKADQMLILAFLQHHASDTLESASGDAQTADPDARR
ncbi:hypothetical protein R3X27_11255 [Tropicimonas sp. TH_r6]|uniref:hypothetical protein n=1 Tax=Tropicimonas sp. TH_r6 TaxID=3082085 RepID=UPI002955A23C|nr:hypothetical protein [Tropicimonas sp. TH_r6]MDV7143259.1 hypothetical protein [Tropicimonas sp. TH_r6]